MSIVDPISDLITRIRNAQMAFKKTVCSPISKMREGVIKVLLDEGYIRGYNVVKCKKTGRDLFNIELKYYDDKPVIYEIKMVSKPGRKVYSPIKDLAFVKNGLGINILSTNKGIMSDVEARKMSLGGEVLCTLF
ncbi:MAG: 30S ribosomal protein S8 [Holosporales bacterium]|jgi:small subunit ribosomal protein S8|nr:30S ribosomal protein S8 [Holosporales bacterium]